MKQTTINKVTQRVNDLVNLPEGFRIVSIYYKEEEDIIFCNAYHPEDNEIVYDITVFPSNNVNVDEREYCVRVYDCDAFAFLDEGGEIVLITEEEHNELWDYFHETRYDEIDSIVKCK